MRALKRKLMSRRGASITFALLLFLVCAVVSSVVVVAGSAAAGRMSQMTTMVEQYLELGAAEQINGVLLGTFSRMEEKGMRPSMPEIVLRMFPENIPVAQTRFVGHGKDARAIVIGREITLNDQERSQC